MTEAKWFRNYGGYSISKRVLDALPPGTKIIYKRIDLNTSYQTNNSKFQKKGILLAYGGHSQWVLPLKNWETLKGMPEEPHKLPIVGLDRWLKGAGGSVLSAGPHIVEDCSIPNDVRLKLADIFRAKYA
jgi:hypothetical protein